MLTVLVFLRSWVLVTPPPELHPGVSQCAPGLAFAFMDPSSEFLDLLPPAFLPPVQKRDAQHMFLQHKGSLHLRSRLSLSQTTVTVALLNLNGSNVNF